MENIFILFIVLFSAGYLYFFFRKTQKEGHCSNCQHREICLKNTCKKPLEIITEKQPIT